MTFYNLYQKYSCFGTNVRVMRSLLKKDNWGAAKIAFDELDGMLEILREMEIITLEETIQIKEKIHDLLRKN